MVKYMVYKNISMNQVFVDIELHMKMIKYMVSLKNSMNQV